MRRFAITLGLTAALAAATAAPAAAQTITPATHDFGVVDPKKASSVPLAEFVLNAGPALLIGTPTVVSGDFTQFSVIQGAGSCGGSLQANQSCTFRVRINPDGTKRGATSAGVGFSNGPTATVTAAITGGPTGGKKSCKKKGKKGAASAKKKKCKKKGKGKRK